MLAAFLFLGPRRLAAGAPRWIQVTADRLTVPASQPARR
jgi:hypothetical protein